MTKGEAPPQRHVSNNAPYPILIPCGTCSPIWMLADQSTLTQPRDAPAESFARPYQLWLGPMPMLNTVAINRRCFALGVLTVRGRARCSVEVVSESSEHFPCKFPRKNGSCDMPMCVWTATELAQNGRRGPGARHFLSISAWNGSCDMIPCAFRLCGLAQKRVLGQDTLYRDLARGALYRGLANRALIESLYRDLAKRPLIEIFCRDLARIPLKGLSQRSAELL